MTEYFDWLLSSITILEFAKGITTVVLGLLAIALIAILFCAIIGLLQVFWNLLKVLAIIIWEPTYKWLFKEKIKREELEQERLQGIADLRRSILVNQITLDSHPDMPESEKESIQSEIARFEAKLGELLDDDN